MSEESIEHLQEEVNDPGKGPPLFQLLCATLGAQVHMALGLIPDPVSKKPIVELAAARQGIDLLVMLEEKTKGNLDGDERKALNGLTAQLRMIYIEVAKLQQTQEQADQPEPPAASEEPPATEEPSATDGAEPAADASDDEKQEA